MFSFSIHPAPDLLHLVPATPAAVRSAGLHGEAATPAAVHAVGLHGGLVDTVRLVTHSRYVLSNVIKSSGLICLKQKLSWFWELYVSSSDS